MAGHKEAPTGSKAPEYFKVGFRETGAGTVKAVEAFSDPHDEELLKQIRTLAPDARLHETHRLVQGPRPPVGRIHEASALVIGTQIAIRARILPTPSILHLPVRVVAEAGDEDQSFDVGDDGDARLILLNLNFSVRGNDLKIRVPSLKGTDLFRAWGNGFRHALVREEAAKVLNENGLFTFA